MPTSTSGYLDTPAKYRDMSIIPSEQDDIEEMVADLPPPKRRRTLAGSIVSTALSAALIGTAVGLTVYRLWRDRGKQPDALPPPPYEQGEWVPPAERTPSPPAQALPSNPASPSTPRPRKPRHIAGRRTVPRHRKTPSRAQIYTPQHTPSAASRLPIPPEFNFNAIDQTADDADLDVDGQMGLMNDKLAQLIAEGQRALGKEIVIMSENKEDEVDDGSGGWVEDEDAPVSGSSSHIKRKSRSALPTYSPPSRTSTMGGRFGTYSGFGSAIAAISPLARSQRGASVESFGSGSFQEDESAWQTPEMRESMERARTLYLRNRAERLGV
ncbi:hypothetical protein A0H81_05946 [Grifola frondosa]|uniref:Uncharacterized protein n=1 Tax=Grifola frondosa TaxID=5627 RepID=A0A1C7MA97_GRIFR|nr:hypothetical protein A0H81_05946 [Grifola frondosa]